MFAENILRILTEAKRRKQRRRKIDPDARHRKLTRAQCERWLRGGKAIRLGQNWYTIQAKVGDSFGLVTSQWEFERGKPFKVVDTDIDEIVDKVNSGKWLVQIEGKDYGGWARGGAAPRGSTIKDD